MRLRFLCSVLAFWSVTLPAGVSETEPEPFAYTALSERLFVIHGERGFGANVGLCVGEHGLLLIDSMLPRSTLRLSKTIQEISPLPVRLILNTHGHADHTGGNQFFSDEGAVIFAQSGTIYDPAYIDVRAHADLAIQYCGEKILTIALEAHTYGDWVIYFSDSNALFLGDIFTNTYFASAYADGLRSELLAIETAVDFADTQTSIIPGHGKIDDIDGVLERQSLIMSWFARVALLQKTQKSVELMLDDPQLIAIAKAFLGADHSFVDPDVRTERFLRRTLNTDFLTTQHLSADEKRVFVGRYRSRFGDEVEIQDIGNRLFVQQRGAFKAELIPSSQDRFHIRGALSGSVSFDRDQAGGIARLKLNYEGTEWEGHRL